MKRRLTWSALMLSLLGGCYVYYDPYYYDYGYYDPYYYGYDGYLVYSAVGGYGGFYLTASPPMPPTVADLNASATALASQADQNFHPAGCATAIASGSTVTYNFNNCAGHFGIGTLSGTANVVLSENNGQVVLTATAPDLTVDGHPAILNFRAAVTEAGGVRTATLETNTRRPDQVDSRNAQGTIVWTPGSGCIDVTGQATSTRGSLTVTSSIDSFHRCVAECPSSGTVMVRTKDGSFAARFDGSSDESISDPGGRARSYALQCQ